VVWSPRGTSARSSKKCETHSLSISNILSLSDWQSSDVHEIVKHIRVITGSNWVTKLDFQSDKVLGRIHFRFYRWREQCWSRTQMKFMFFFHFSLLIELKRCARLKHTGNACESLITFLRPKKARSFASFTKKLNFDSLRMWMKAFLIEQRIRRPKTREKILQKWVMSWEMTANICVNFDRVLRRQHLHAIVLAVEIDTIYYGYFCCGSFSG
jgi:hypothetical protein